MDGTRLALPVSLGLALSACREDTTERVAPRDATIPLMPAVFAQLRITPAQGWIRLPTAEAAAREAIEQEPPTATEIEAWGDPAAGCYAIAVASRGGSTESSARTIERFAAQLAPLGVEATALPKPTRGVVDAKLPIATRDLTGTLRVRMYPGADQRPQLVALACAGNAREPERCKGQCQALDLQLAPPGAP